MTLATSGGSDQTIRVIENNFDICDGLIWFFPTFPVENFLPFQSFPIIFPFQKMVIPDFLKFSDCFPFQRMKILDICNGHNWFFKHFQWKLSTIRLYSGFSKDGNP
jgi:hypothetical protein